MRRVREHVDGACRDGGTFGYACDVSEGPFKDNLKLRLAYSTVSQLSYIILGVALLTPTGIAGGLFGRHSAGLNARAHL